MEAQDNVKVYKTIATWTKCKGFALRLAIYANKINHALLYIAEYNCNFKKRPLWFSAHLKLSDTVPPTIPIRAGTVLDFISSQGTIQDRTCPTPSLVPVLKKRNRKSFSFLKFSNFEDA